MDTIASVCIFGRQQLSFFVKGCVIEAGSISVTFLFANNALPKAAKERIDNPLAGYSKQWSLSLSEKMPVAYTVKPVNMPCCVYCLKEQYLP